MSFKFDCSHISTKSLLSQIEALTRQIESQEASILKTKSFLYGLYLSSQIKEEKQRIHKIEAELAYREKHNK